jgi:hypothetical protein
MVKYPIFSSVLVAASITYLAMTVGEVDGSVLYLNGEALPHPFVPVEIQEVIAAGTDTTVGGVDGKIVVF